MFELWPSWLLPLSVLSSVTTQIGVHDPLHPYRNSSQQLRNADFSIDEAQLLNRHFLDYLVAIDELTVQDSADPKCFLAMQQLASAYLARQRHGLEWFDSWGKIPSGLFYQHGYAVGNVDQCRKFAWENIRGQHCTFLGALPGDLAILYSGLCVPQFCNPDSVQELYSAYLKTQGVVLIPLVKQELLCIRDEEINYDGAMVTGIVMAALIASCVVGSTCYELIQLGIGRDVKPLYGSFSLLRNIRSILQLDSQANRSAKKSNMIECAHGIRALSMIWIIVLHVHETIYQLQLENTPARDMYFKTFPATLLFYTGQLAVDTFLALSGMLVALSMLRELDKKGKINPLMLYLHRYIRITAPFAALILFVVSFARYMGEGVFWKVILGSLKETCEKNWWTALLHVQNYVNPTQMCLSWSWYLSVDMQLYILAPALIYPLWRFGNRALTIVIGLAVLSMGCVLTSFLVNELRLFGPTLNPLKYTLTYYPTHARMAVWLWGLAFGYILHKTRESEVNLPKRYWTTGWVTCFVLLSLIVYGNYEIYTTDAEKFSHVVDAFFEPLSRTMLGLCVLWIIFACVNGKGGLLDEFLSAPMWQPLSKLSFSMYLLHILLILMASIAPVKTSTYFSEIDLFYRIWGAIGLTTSVALLWSAIFEIPFISLDKLLLRR